MHELWYKITTPYATVEVQDYKTAMSFKDEGARVETVFKYKNLDHVEDKERREKILKIYF